MSEANVKKVQDLIKRDVYVKSNYKYLIDEQSKDEVILLMRSIYLQYSRNLPNNIDKQIDHLNGLVVLEATPIVLSNVDMHYHYLAHLKHPQFTRPIEHPINVSRKGENSLVGSAQRLPIYKGRNYVGRLEIAQRYYR